MKNVVGLFLTELRLAKPLQFARRSLVEIDSSESNIEPPYLIVMMCRDHYPREAKEDVKDIVRRCTACKSFLIGNYEAEDAHKDEDRGEDDQNPIIEVMH